MATLRYLNAETTFLSVVRFWVLGFFSILNNFTFTVLGILHFRLAQFFKTTQFHSENFLQH